MADDHRGGPRSTPFDGRCFGQPPFIHPLSYYIDEILTRLVSSTDHTHGLSLIAEAAARLSGAPKTSICLLEPGGLRVAAKFIEPDGYFEFVKGKEVGGNIIPGEAHPGLYAVAAQGRSVFAASPGIHDLKERYTGLKVEERPSFGYLREPILFEGEVIGVLSLTLEEGQMAALNDYQRAMMRRLLKFAGIAIRNARLVEELRQANAAKDELLATISHEMKTPLVTIKLAAQSLLLGRLGGLNERQREALEMAERAVDREGFLIDKLLEYCRLGGGQMVLSAETLDLGEVVAASVRPFLIPAEQKGISLRHYAHNGRLPVRGDRLRLEMVFNNLLENAIKFSPPGSTVAVSLGRNGAFALAAVADEGPGIPEGEREAVFRRFYQIRDGGGRPPGGMGIGLAVVRGLVELHQGRVELESTVGEGSRFTVNLPLHEGG